MRPLLLLLLLLLVRHLVAGDVQLQLLPLCLLLLPALPLQAWLWPWLQLPQMSDCWQCPC
jgi:hypothetical protein